MAKWWKIANTILNPIGTGLAELAKKIGVDEKVANNIATPFGGSWFASLGRKTRAEQKRANIERIANDSGMTLEEFLAVNPDMAKEYENADKNFIEKFKGKVKDTLNEIRENPDVDALINNITGERDTAENEKNRQFQHDEAEISRQWEEEQAKAAREWDSIGSQMERAAAAGVNPISIAMQNGGIGSSATTSIPSAPSAPAGSANLTHSGIFDIAGMVFNGIGTLAENRLKQSQSDDIVAMRQYNIAEKIANTNHLQQLCEGVGLSNVAQRIQNRWLDAFSQAEYDGMLIQNGVGRATILEKRSVAKLNLKQVSEIDQNMEMALKRFNATLPLELQLAEADISLKKMSSKELYEEISLRHLQQIEQENRNRQSSAEAGSAEVAESLARATYEDAINSFHNDMVQHAAEAGIALNDYIYYSGHPKNLLSLPASIFGSLRDFSKADWFKDPSKQLKGLYPE